MTAAHSNPTQTTARRRGRPRTDPRDRAGANGKTTAGVAIDAEKLHALDQLAERLRVDRSTLVERGVDLLLLANAAA